MFLVPLTRRSTAFAHPLASWFDERSFDRFVSPASRTARVQRSPALDVSGVADGADEAVERAFVKPRRQGVGKGGRAAGQWDEEHGG